MKAISLWQPWASAIPAGLKSIETRSWAPPKNLYGERIAIHAAKRTTPEPRNVWCAIVLGNAEFSSAFARIGIHSWPDLPFGREGDMPFGAIVATATLAACVSTNDDPADYTTLQALATDELWGNFSPDRYAWFLTDIKRVVPTIPCVGRQGFFEVPDLN